ncbi:hypothetical protein JGU71_28610 [Antrihabitans sp. YC3-6]|uniref:Sigma-54 factor interaction domain-containing protein n=1 Tax=Antrihabitans stalagmiti TaxID=2799499 RepID=A0A934NX36_9NOCA|nr:helix-turn-helix domain-containing protein [Antrihabitans stalagmiti]MBJ8342859.1 hypothetical protein [Antrihabitans stalagmiti]
MSDLVRRAREELIRVGLLGESHAAGVVPDLVLRSWRRSIGNSVASTSLSERFQQADTDSMLLRAADPVLDRWQHQLTDTDITLFLSDRAGSIVARRTGDSSVSRRLDRIHAAEGFDYSEDSIGTNGLGTSMVEKRAVYIEGTQHYSDALASLACAAAPVCTPTGLVLGSISLGGPIEMANPLMLSVTREIGQQIEERLRSSSRPQDLALAMSFMRYKNSRRPTLVMDEESLLANTPGLSYVDVGSHVALWQLLSDQDWSAGSAVLQLDGLHYDVTARRVLDGPRAHYVMHFDDRPEAQAEPRSFVAQPHSSKTTPAAAFVVVEGPRGSGRATTVLESFSNREDTTDVESIDLSIAGDIPWPAVTAALADGRNVLLRRAEGLAAIQARDLSRVAHEHRAAVAAGKRRSVLLLTVCSDTAADDVRSAVDEIGVSIRTHPLTSNRERIPGLVKSILDRVDPDGQHSLSPAALQALVQWSWPGNISELIETLTELVRTADGSVIERRQLPRHIQQAPTSRRLTLMQTAERDAILKALDNAGGNKSEAATLLGIGRTTLYRRIRELGLASDESSL